MGKMKKGLFIEFWESLSVMAFELERMNYRNIFDLIHGLTIIKKYFPLYVFILYEVKKKWPNTAVTVIPD